MIVVDAGVLAVALLDDGGDGDRARSRLMGEELFAPELVDLEALSVFCARVRGGAVEQRRAALAVADLTELPMTRAPHRGLLERVWELRDSLSSYDAAYVALAEALQVPVLTADRRLARAAGVRCEVEALA